MNALRVAWHLFAALAGDYGPRIRDHVISRYTMPVLPAAAATEGDTP